MSKTKIFLTSDTMFGRKNIINHAKRPFKSVEEMDEKMTKLWNDKVKDNDIVYHLGNFAWDPFIANIMLGKLKGKIYFLNGNTDKALKESAQLYDNVKMYDDQIIELPKLKAILCHWPLEYWNGKEDGIFHFHGHNYKDFPHKANENRINVCADCWNLAPVEIDTIKELINEYKQTL